MGPDCRPKVRCASPGDGDVSLLHLTLSVVVTWRCPYCRDRPVEHQALEALQSVPRGPDAHPSRAVQEAVLNGVVEELPSGQGCWSKTLGRHNATTYPENSTVC